MAEVSDVDPESFSIPLRTSAHPPLSVETSDTDPEKSSVPLGRTLMGTSWKKAGVEPWDALGPVTSDVADLRGAFGEAYRATAPESISRPGQRSMFTPETQTSISQWPYGTGAVTNAVGDIVGTGVAGVAGVGNSALALGNQALKSVGLPPALIRDINVEATNAPFAPELRPPPELRPGIKPADAPAMREMMQPPTPSLPSVLRQQRAALPPDPATQAAIDILRRATGAPDMPTPPTPFRGAPYQPPIPGSVPPIPLSPIASPTTAAEAKAVAGRIYNQANSAGGTLTPQFTDKFIDSASAVQPQTAAGQIVVGESPVAKLVDRMQQLRGKPLSLAEVQEMDEGLGSLIDNEWRLGRGLTKDGTKFADIQRNFRDQIQNADAGDTTGGTAGFQVLGTARQAWSQAMKMQDLERMQYRASQTDNPTTSFKTQVRTYLANDAKSRGWSDAERAALEDAANRGVVGGALRVFGSRLTPQIMGGVGFGSGGPVGGAIAMGLTEAAQTPVRAAINAVWQNRVQRALDTLGRGVPPAGQ